MLEGSPLEVELSSRRAPRIVCLLKVGQREHLESLAAGHLRFRALSYYRGLERSAAQHDANEGIAAILQAHRTRLTVSAVGISADMSHETGLRDQVLAIESRRRMVLCLHAIHGGQWNNREFGEDALEEVRRELHVPQSMARLGDHAWIITDAALFRTRLRAAVERADVELHGRLVQYVPFASVHGRVPRDLRGFVKDAGEYEDEREYRLIVDSPTPLDDPFVLEVGDLGDVSVILPFEQLKEALSFSFRSDGGKAT